MKGKWKVEEGGVNTAEKFHNMAPLWVFEGFFEDLSNGQSYMLSSI